MQFLELYVPGQLGNLWSKATTFDTFFRPHLIENKGFFFDKYIVFGMYFQSKIPSENWNNLQASNK